MIPAQELDTYSLIVTESVDLALDGEIGDGYTCLLAGRHRAREALEDGEPWAAELLRLYQKALDNYAARWSLARE